MMGATLLRGVALAIAIAGLVDPAFSVARREAPPVVVAILGEPTPEAHAAAERIRGALDDGSNARLRIATGAERAAACPANTRCVLVHAAGAIPRVMSDGSQVLGALVLDAAVPPLQMVRVDGPAVQHPQAAGRLRIQVQGAAVRTGGRVEVRDGDALVGAADFAAGDREAATVDVPWWPMSSGARALRLEVRSADGNVAAADAGVNVAPGVHGVVVYDGRPSWTSTFVRRAVEGDPRFEVRARSRLGPDVSVNSADSIRLDVATLEWASTVIVGGPEALAAGDVEALDRFVRERGGTLILLPDREVSGPIARLVPAGLRERLEREPLATGPLRATELLVAKPRDGAHALLSTLEGDAVVVASPMGEGRVIFSGALDAWRYRSGADDGFDGFWRSTVADAVLAGGRTLDVTTSPALARVGDDVRIALRLRSMDVPGEVRAMAQVSCEGDAPSTLRLWPSGRGLLAGTFVAARPGRCQVHAEAGLPRSEGADTAFVAAEAPLSAVNASGGRIEALVAAFGAPLVRAGDEETLVAAARGRMAGAASERREDRHPLRSPWWIVPFVACLGGEWWLRRRRGVR